MCSITANRKTQSYQQFTRILVLNMVYRKNFYFTVATVINILHCSILVKQQIQNFKVLKKLISSVLASVSIGRAGLSKFCSTMDLPPPVTPSCYNNICI